MIRQFLKNHDGPTHEVDVYGPGTHAALERAALGDIVNDPNPKKDFYLIVKRGKYVCGGCSTPGPPAKVPRGTVEMSVWSPKSDAGDFGIGPELPAAISRLHPIAVITLS